MKVLSNQEIKNVNGGIAPALAIGIGAAGGAIAGYRSNGLEGAAVGALTGAAAVVTGGLAAATSGFVRLGWAVRSVVITGIGAGGSSSSTGITNIAKVHVKPN